VARCPFKGGSASWFVAPGGAGGRRKPRTTDHGPSATDHGPKMLETLQTLDVVQMISQAGIVAKMVLALLLGISIFSWAIILLKFKTFRASQRESRRFLAIYQETKDFADLYSSCNLLRRSSLVKLFKAGYLELQQIRKEMLSKKIAGELDLPADLADWIEEVEALLQRVTAAEMASLEKYLVFLATISTSAPLIGLFGTVWGVMNAFRSIGTQGFASIGAVAPGVAEALVTTVAGLATAIPASIFYNYFVNRVKLLILEMETFSSELTSMIKQEIKGTK